LLDRLIELGPALTHDLFNGVCHGCRYAPLVFERLVLHRAPLYIHIMLGPGKLVPQLSLVIPYSGLQGKESPYDLGLRVRFSISYIDACLYTYVVKKGDSLWTIAKKKNVYNDPFLWPVIYEANKGKIKKANLIYPGQKLKIPRSGITTDAVKDARKKAGAKKPYLPPAAAIVPES
jgi:hypothetical protein